MADMLGIGISGLLATQRSLQTVSHNIANANTEGYSRQRVELTTQAPIFAGGSFLGSGVNVNTVERVYNDFLVDQVRTYSASAGYADTFEQYASIIDEILADPDIGMAASINEFFSELQSVASDPASTASRQAVFTQAETLIDDFANINQRFDDIRGQLNLQINNVVAEVNSLAEAVAGLNRNIVLASGNNPPNDLLDQRDALLNELSRKIGISTLEQDNGAVNVFFGNGQQLVVNFDSYDLSVENNEFNIRDLEVSYATGGGGQIQVSSQISGGELGAIFDFRNELDTTYNSLGALAIGFVDTFNAQHRLGQDLNGNLGLDFFNVPGLEILPSTNNDSTAPFNADVDTALTDSTKLTGDEYLLSYSAVTGYSLRRQSDGFTEVIGAALNYDPSAGIPSAAFEDYGFSLSLASGTQQDGDTFLITPGARGAQDLGINITSPAEIAAAAPVRSSAQILANTGTGVISPVVVTDTSDFQASPLPPLSSDIVMQFDGANINVVSGPAPWNGLSFAYNEGETITALPGLEFTLSGALSVGPPPDEFRIESNVNGVGDNSNALLLSDLQQQRLLNDGAASYIESYSGLVADVGVMTSQAQSAQTAQGNLLTQALNSRDSLSGVNLDEEAANLIKFQQAYQASSQVIVAANTMFETLLSALRS